MNIIDEIGVGGRRLIIIYTGVIAHFVILGVLCVSSGAERSQLTCLSLLSSGLVLSPKVMYDEFHAITRCTLLRIMSFPNACFCMLWGSSTFEYVQYAFTIQKIRTKCCQPLCVWMHPQYIKHQVQ